MRTFAATVILALAVALPGGAVAGGPTCTNGLVACGMTCISKAQVCHQPRPQRCRAARNGKSCKPTYATGRHIGELNLNKWKAGGPPPAP